MCKYLDCPFMVSHADTGAACLCVVYLYWALCLCLCVLSFCEVCIRVCVVTLIARSWSLMLTLVLRCQQTCMVVLARCWTFLSWDTPFTSPSTPTLSDEPVTDKNINVKTCADKNSHYIHAFNKPQVIKIHFLPQNSNKVYRLYSELANIFPGHQKPCLRKVFDN